MPLRERQRGGYPEAVRDGLTDINEVKLRTRAGMGIARAGPAARLWRPLRRKPRAGHTDMGRLHVRSPAARAAFRPPAASETK
ncbi:MAG: hypothetical protein ACLSAH_13305 [Bilophila wadsworthia]